MVSDPIPESHVNVFLHPDRSEQLFVALPSEVVAGDDGRALLARDGQARLWWDRTRIDLFSTEVH